MSNKDTDNLVYFNFNNKILINNNNKLEILYPSKHYSIMPYVFIATVNNVDNEYKQAIVQFEHMYVFDLEQQNTVDYIHYRSTISNINDYLIEIFFRDNKIYNLKYLYIYKDRNSYIKRHRGKTPVYMFKCYNSIDSNQQIEYYITAEYMDNYLNMIIYFSNV